MARPIRIKARKAGAETEILAMVSHPMETGQRKDKKTDKPIPAHYIQKMDFAVNGKLVASCNLGAAVSQNAMVGIRVKGVKAGDKVTVSWNDNLKENGSETQAV